MWTKKPHPMPFCERSFGTFFVIWGLILLMEGWLGAAQGLFFGRLESYMPAWAWGTVLSSIGVARYFAFRRKSAPWRRRLSTLTLIVLVVIAAIAIATGLWGATAPLAVYVACVAYWCHVALLRDMRLGL